MTNWLVVAQLGVALLGGGLMAAIVNVILNPKARAETRQIAEATARAQFEASIAVVRADLLDCRAQGVEMMKRAIAAEHAADRAEDQVDYVRAQNRILIDHIWSLQLWVRRNHTATQDSGLEAPPMLTPAQLHEAAAGRFQTK